VRGILVALAVFVVTLHASAQETTGALGGKLVDTQGVGIPDATITITGPLGSKALITDANGRFFATFLAPATYDLRAELQGFKAVDISGIRVHLGQTTQATIRTEPGSLTETVTMTGNPMIVDTTSSTIGAVLDDDLFQRVPVGRRVAGIVHLVPGALETLHVVDGVNMSRSPMMPLEVVSEVVVKTGGYEAEFGQSLGGIVDTVTRGGGNQTRGTAFGYANTAGPDESDIGAALGGRILTNRLFFFAALNPSWQTDSRAQVDRRRRTLPYLTKTTWEAVTANHIDLVLFGDPSNGETESTSAKATVGKSGGHYQTLRYHAAVGANTLVETSLSRVDDDVDEGFEYTLKTTFMLGDHAVKAGFLSDDVSSAFLQNQWKANDRLTLNAGIRYEDPPSLARADPSFGGAGSWAPRIGAVYDPLGTGRSKLYANWGRYIGPSPSTALRASPNERLREDSETPLPYKNEFLAGYEWQALPNTLLGGRFIYRHIGREPQNLDPALSANALELTVDRRFRDNWGLTAWYRLAQHDQFKVFGSYGFANGLSIGTALAFAADSDVDMQVSYALGLGGGRRLRVLATAFNLLETRSPFALRLGARFGW
jgi:hypothetical protein